MTKGSVIADCWKFVTMCKVTCASRCDNETDVIWCDLDYCREAGEAPGNCRRGANNSTQKVMTINIVRV